MVNQNKEKLGLADKQAMSIGVPDEFPLTTGGSDVKASSDMGQYVGYRMGFGPLKPVVGVGLVPTPQNDHHKWEYFRFKKLCSLQVYLP